MLPTLTLLLVCDETTHVFGCLQTRYVLVYLWRGRLPWQGFRATTRDELSVKIAAAKEATTDEELCRQVTNKYRIVAACACVRACVRACVCVRTRARE